MISQIYTNFAKKINTSTENIDFTVRGKTTE